MTNYIEHEAFVNLYNKDQEIFDRLFKETNDWKTLNKALQKESKNYKNFAYTEEQGKEKMIGDLFEIFAELFFKILAADTRIAIYDYKPVKASEDYGVDGTGKNVDNSNMAIQVKYRSNPTVELITDDLRNVQGQAYRIYKVPVEGKNIVIFTNCKGVHYKTEKEVFGDALLVYGTKTITDRVDNNFPFWNLVRDYVNETIKIRYNIIKK